MKADVVVTVVIVSFNTREITLKSIASVYASRGFKNDEIEVIVIDNASTDDSVSAIRKKYPEVVLIANTKNYGFGGGNNQGIKMAKGPYVLLLNSDAFLEPTSLQGMVGVLKDDVTVSSVGPQLRYQNGSVQQSAGYSPTPRRVLAWMWWLDKIPLIKKLFSDPYHIYDVEWYKKDHYPDWLMGACVLFRKKELLAAGGFDEKIFMYAEEVELYRRLAESTRKKNFFMSSTWVTHLGSVSTKKANAYRLAYELKGIEYIYRKHYPGLYLIIKGIIVIGVMMRIALYSLIPGRREAVTEYKKYFQS